MLQVAYAHLTKILDSGILLFLGHHLVYMNGDDDADEDANRGHDAQNWHVKDNTAPFQSWNMKMYQEDKNKVLFSHLWSSSQYQYKRQ